MKAAIIGYGKMGREIERLLLERGHKVGLIVDIGNADDLNSENMCGMDVAIEFTTPEGALGNIHRCLEIGVPVVCGTTAWTAHLPEIEVLCRERNGAFFYASNYSVGVNVVFELNRRLAALMNRFSEYDVTVEEVHHIQKKDAPSGTAIVLADDIVTALDRKTRWIGGRTNSWTGGCADNTITEVSVGSGCSNNAGAEISVGEGGTTGIASGAPDPAELEVVSVRRSVAPGTHTITWESPVDAITLTHNTKSRAGLAAGAVSAAEFLVDEVAAGRRGMFSMKDLLNL